MICADKTGTMTENQMTVSRVWLGGRTITVGGGPRSRAGDFAECGRPIEPLADRGLSLLLTVGALVDDAGVEPGPDGLSLHGDPTEAALLVAAIKWGLDPGALALAWPRRGEIPLRALLGTVSLAGRQWLTVSVAVLWPMIVMELRRGWGRPGPVGVPAPHLGAAKPGARYRRS